MKQGLFRVECNLPIAPNIYKMVLRGETGAISAPGQFINIRLDGFSVRRPISVCDYDEDTVTIVYKVVGDGTECMSQLAPGGALDVLSGLGNGFDLEKCGEHPLVVGGGVGAAPLYRLSRELMSRGARPHVILGFSGRRDMILVDDFLALGAELTLATVDGSAGVRGFAADAMPDGGYTYFFACGPSAMLNAVNAKAAGSGQLSLEAHMGCGFGACMSCSCRTLLGAKRVCKDGPVFKREEIIWPI